MNPLIIAIALGGSLATLFFDWKTLVKLAMYAVVFEGAIRKWIVPSANELVYFAKDFMLMVAYAKFFLFFTPDRRRVRGTLILKALVALNFIYLSFSIANPTSNSLAVGVFGMRCYMLYVPLIFVLSELFETVEELVDYLKWYSLLIIPLAILAVIQSNSDPGSWLNRESNSDLANAALAGTRVRASATFPYLQGYVFYIMFAVSLLVPLFFAQLSPRWWMLIRASAVMLVPGALATGSRGSVSFIVLFCLLYALINNVGLLKRLKKKTVFGVLAMVLIGANTVFAPQLEGLIVRFSGSSTDHELLKRLSQPFNEISWLYRKIPLFGVGAGAAHQAAAGVRGRLHEPSFNYPYLVLEAESSRVMVELGMVGLTFWYGFRLSLVVLLFVTYRRTANPILRELCIGAFITHLFAFTGQLITSTTAAFYYFWLAGMIHLAPRLEMEEKESIHRESAARADIPFSPVG